MIDEGKAIAEEYEAVVKITVLAVSPEDAQEQIEKFLDDATEADTIREFEFVEEATDD